MTNITGIQVQHPSFTRGDRIVRNSIGILLFIAILLATAARVAASDTTATPETLLIGPGDVLHVQILDTPELEQHPRVTDAGTIPLTGVGSAKVIGLTPQEAAAKVRQLLISSHYMNHPDVTVTVESYASQTVSVLGQVKDPGTYSIATPRSVMSVISLAGGLTNSADYRITIQHHGGTEKPTKYTLSNDPDVAIANDVKVMPGDTVIVPRAGIAYVLGDVGRPGGFVMQNNHSQLTVLQAVALAGGTLSSAVPSHARLIRLSDSGYKEVPINFSAIQKGKAPDLQLNPDDVIYIPYSYLRNIASTSSGIAAATAGAAVYAIP
jgi:polysaccharide biosynthesis/export protein